MSSAAPALRVVAAGMSVALLASSGCMTLTPQLPPTDFEALEKVEDRDERERLWAQMAKIYPPYDEYQERAGARTIPVVVLDPVD